MDLDNERYSTKDELKEEAGKELARYIMENGPVSMEDAHNEVMRYYPVDEFDSVVNVSPFKECTIVREHIWDSKEEEYNTRYIVNEVPTVWGMLFYIGIATVLAFLIGVFIL